MGGKECPTIEELTEKLTNDEARVQESIEQLLKLQKTANSADVAEALGIFQRFVARSSAVRAWLAEARTAPTHMEQADFSRQFAGQLVQNSWRPRFISGAHWLPQ